MKKMENKYNEHIKKEKIRLSSNTIDFMGINIDLETGDYGVKTYYSPVSCMQYTPKITNEILTYTTKNNMNRFFWLVRDEWQIREYIALKNRTNKKMEGLYELLKRYNYINENIVEIKRMSEMKFTDKEDSKYSSLYILGLKGDKEKKIINFEWFTRKCPDPDDVGYMYKYDDEYFLNYLATINIIGYNILAKMAQRLLFYYASINMHLWCFASDYFSDNNVKHKIYFKGNFENITFRKIIEVANLPIKDYIVSEVDEFIQCHTELILYGFAICVNSKEHFSINCYFRFK